MLQLQNKQEHYKKINSYIMSESKKISTGTLFIFSRQLKGNMCLLHANMWIYFEKITMEFTLKFLQLESKR
jgi:hypothetical protein